MEEAPDIELMLNRFKRLLKEIQQGAVRRTTFQPWEVDFLVDLQDCRLTPSRRDEALRRYQKAVQHQLERGQLPPMRFSEFVGRRARKLALANAPPGPLASDNPATLHA